MLAALLYIPPVFIYEVRVKRERGYTDKYGLRGWPLFGSDRGSCCRVLAGDAHDSTVHAAHGVDAVQHLQKPEIFG